MADLDKAVEEEKDTSQDSATENKPTQQDVPQEDAGTSENQTPDSSQEEQSSEGEQKDTEPTEEEVLKDGEEISKSTIPYDRFREVNEKAKVAKQYEDVIQKLEENPELKDKILEAEKESDLPGQASDQQEADVLERVRQEFAPLQEELRKIKTRETSQALREVMTEIPDFKKNWDKVKRYIPAAESVEGTYKEALYSAYAMANKDKVLGTSQGSESGVMSSASGDKPKVAEKPDMTPEEEEVARLAGLTPERFKDLKDNGKL